MYINQFGGYEVELIKETAYKQLVNHRKKFHWCGKLIEDGESFNMWLSIKEQVYPVKGIMRFQTYYFTHTGCKTTRKRS